MSRIARIVAALAAFVSSTRLASAQESEPTPPAAMPMDRVVIELRTLPGEQPLLLLSPRQVAPLAVPALDGGLALDPNGLQILAGVSDGTGASRFVVPRRPGIPMDLHGQALLVNETGIQLSLPFGLCADDFTLRAVKPATGIPAQVLPRRVPVVADRPELGLVRAPVAVLHDPRHGQDRLIVWLVPEGRSPAAQQQAGRCIAGDGGEGPVSLADSSGMSALSILAAADSDDYPYRMNCKLWMNAPNGSFGGSGSLIDPYHVITAGHCVYDPSDMGGIASQITVGPAYDDNRSSQLPFGTANWFHNSTRQDAYLMWAGWSLSQDPEHDIAVIELDRPIGALTSWFGFGYSSDCDFYENNTFYAGSYPIESHTGNDMYWRSGSFDYCPSSTESRFWRYSYGGESGSGYYWKSSTDGRYVQGVLSHGNWTVWNGDVTDVVRLNAEKYDALQSFLTSARPATADLIPLGVSVSSTSVVRGNQVDFAFRVLNYGRTAFTPNWTYSVRLSSDARISTSDPALVSGMSTIDIGSVDVCDHTVRVTIPTGIAAGTWYLGVILTVSDASPSNNITAVTDVVQLTVL